MIGVAPAFWVKYRGEVDPQRPDLDTNYQYIAYMWYAGMEIGNPNTPLQFSVTTKGPPQLNKANFMEIRWTIPPGVVGIGIITATSGYWYYLSNAAEGGTRDEGRYKVLGSGVLQQ